MASMRLFLFVLLAVSILPFVGAAQAASFDCTKAATSVEKTICADPVLSQADDQLAETYGAALAVAFRPATLRIEQMNWLAARNKLSTAEALRHAYQGRLRALVKMTEAARKAHEAVTVEQAGKACILPPGADPDASCTLDSFGTVDGDSTLRYQLQTYRDGDLQVAGGLVVFKPTDDRLRAITAVADDDVYYGKPRIIASPAGKLLVLPGYIPGTGNFNAEVLYRYDSGHLTELDTQSWQRDLQRRLPNGWAVWKGIYPDYKTFTASTPLWQSSDGNCCPTAGRADITLGLAGGRLVLRDLVIAKGEDAARRDQ